MKSTTNVVQKKIGRPRIGEENADIFSVRWPREITVRVDAYAKCKAIKTRGEAIRALVLLGLNAHDEAEMKRTARVRRTKKAD
jgi:hypothetical protein